MFLQTIGCSAWQNPFDFGIEHLLNNFAHKSFAFDWAMDFAASSELFRGGALMLFVWYALFDPERPGQLRKGAELIVATIIPGTIISVLCARLFAHLLPFRLRPIATPSLHFLPPVAGTQILFDWSSFPSDHAMLFFLVATGVSFVSWRIGLLAYLWVTVIICFPRLYLGFHWPTDVLAGALLGVGLAWLELFPPFRRWMRALTFSWSSRHPRSFFVVIFFFTFQVGTMYHDTYPLVVAFLKHFA